jgi:hypothetical protein
MSLKCCIRQVRQIYYTARLANTKTASGTADQIASAAELSNILSSSKIRVSNQELKQGQRKDKRARDTPQYSLDSAGSKSQEDIINSVFLPPEIRRALKTSGKREADKLTNRGTKESRNPSRDKARRTHPYNSSKDGAGTSVARGVLRVQHEQLNQVVPLDVAQIPRLLHNLDRTLFSPGVHFLQDPRTRVFNFAPHLKHIIDLDEFDPDALAGFLLSLKDPHLRDEGRRQNKRYLGSTSSMTGILLQFYLLLNGYRTPAGPSAPKLPRFMFPPFFKAMSTNAALVVVQPRGLNDRGEVMYAVDSDKLTDQEIVLLAMGHVLEALLTNSEAEFERLTKKGATSASADSNASEPPAAANVYNYSTYSSFLMRSQLDCYDPRLPGNGTFDVKTRAVCAIRYDNANPDVRNNLYQIWKQKGRFESFQREYIDLIRTGALLKYGFQARIGQMDGIFVGYHNINSFFGFEYLPLEEIDRVFYLHKHKSADPPIDEIHGLQDLKDLLPTYVAQEQFKQSLSLWEEILDAVVADVARVVRKNAQFKPTKSTSPLQPLFRLVFKTDTEGAKGPSQMNIMAVPLTETEVATLQGLPAAFRTSFRDDIPPEEKLQQLKKHRQSVLDFSNASSSNGVLNYRLSVTNLINNRRTSYPESESHKWLLKYRLERLDSNPREYLKQIKVRADQLVQHFERAFNAGLTAVEDETEAEEVDVEEDEEDEGDMGLDLEAGAETEASMDAKTDADLGPADERISCTVRNDMRVYSAIGRVRAKKWEPLEKTPVVYTPSQ